MYSLTDKPIIKIDRRTLEKIFPDNESLKKFEDLLRILNSLIPEDLESIYTFIENNNNHTISIDSKLNSIIGKIKELSSTNKANGTFVTADGKVITVQNGLITNII